jgi:hypothetical protein
MHWLLGRSTLSIERKFLYKAFSRRWPGQDGMDAQRFTSCRYLPRQEVLCDVESKFYKRLESVPS